MKKLIALVAIIAFTMSSLSLNAQDRKRRDGVVMKDGKVMVIKDGKKSPLTEDMAMSDGSKVMKDGTVVMPDGSTKMMNNDEMITMDGQWHSKMHRDKMQEKTSSDKATDSGK